MPAYVVVTPLRRGMPDDPVPPGKPVELDAAEGDALVLIGALAKASDEDEVEESVKARRQAKGSRA